MCSAVSRRQCMASAVTTESVMSMLSSRSRRAGISLLLADTASWPTTAPAAWSNAATRCGAPAGVRAPRMVLPSKAMTRRPARCPTRVAIHPAIRASRSLASSWARVRRIVDAEGRAWSGLIPMRDTLSRIGISPDQALPSESTIRRTLAQLDANDLDARLAGWMATRVGHLAGRRVIAFDGKTMRGARTPAGAPHLVAAFDHAAGAVVGQLAVSAKSNEIPALRDLLE